MGGRVTRTPQSKELVRAKSLRQALRERSPTCVHSTHPKPSHPAFFSFLVYGTNAYGTNAFRKNDFRTNALRKDKF